MAADSSPTTRIGTHGEFNSPRGCRAKPLNWLGVVAEWTPDYTSPERIALTNALLRHGGGVSLAVQYLFAQMSAGIVSTPTFVKNAAEEATAAV